MWGIDWTAATHKAGVRVKKKLRND